MAPSLPKAQSRLCVVPGGRAGLVRINGLEDGGGPMVRAALCPLPTSIFPCTQNSCSEVMHSGKLFLRDLNPRPPLPAFTHCGTAAAFPHIFRGSHGSGLGRQEPQLACSDVIASQLLCQSAPSFPPPSQPGTEVQPIPAGPPGLV